MATKVSYKLGTKAKYLSLTSRDSNSLYFCLDTRELFKGNDLYSDGLRIVENYAALPAFTEAADGILYFCKDNGCGYVLNEARDGWLSVVHGVDNDTIAVNGNGLIAVKAVPLTSVTGLADRLQAVEKALVSGVHYRGAVDTVEDLPADAEQGDLYEVRADNSEWCYNGEQWFEYGKITDLSDYITQKEVRTIAKLVDYEISNKPLTTLVRYLDKEIRILCPSDTEWALQNSGENADANSYYIGLKAYAPSNDIVSFKEDLGEIITDNTMYYFENNEFAGIDEYGRKYSIVWLPVAAYDSASDSWTYYGDQSTKEKQIGWYYSVEWYNADGVKVGADTIRINLANDNCYTSTVPYYVSELQATVQVLEETCTWEEM